MTRAKKMSDGYRSSPYTNGGNDSYPFGGGSSYGYRDEQPPKPTQPSAAEINNDL
jgi:hypothetical protein